MECQLVLKIWHQLSNYFLEYFSCLNTNFVSLNIMVAVKKYIFKFRNLPFCYTLKKKYFSKLLFNKASKPKNFYLYFA